MIGMMEKHLTLVEEDLEGLEGQVDLEVHQ